NGHTRHRNAVPSRCTRHAYRVEAGEEDVTAWLTSSVPAARPSCCDASPLMGMSRLMPLWRRIWPVPPENGRIYNMFPAVVLVQPKNTPSLNVSVLAGVQSSSRSKSVTASWSASAHTSGRSGGCSHSILPRADWMSIVQPLPAAVDGQRPESHAEPLEPGHSSSKTTATAPVPYSPLGIVMLPDSRLTSTPVEIVVVLTMRSASDVPT